MNIIKYLLVLFSFNLYASFYKETVIDSRSPLSVLDPARRAEVERLVTNLRFFGNLGPRPSKDVFIHHQAVQNLLVFPTSHLTALSWMLFPISPLPTINPNNVRVSDPLGKLTPENLGKLIGVMGRFANPYVQLCEADDLLEIFQIFDPKNASELLKNYSPDINPELQEFYRYSLLDALNKYVNMNLSIAELDDEDCNISEEKKADIKANPHRLVAFDLCHSASHLLEIPGTEILRQNDETWFTETELDAELQELPKDVKHRVRYKELGYKAREEYQIHAAVDMLYKAAKAHPTEVLELLTYYAWRKYPEQIQNVIWASGAVNQAQYAKLMEVLSAPYSKADYEALVTEFKAAENVDAFFESLTPAQQNLLLYGGARYDALRMQDYGNVRVEHAGRFLSFANCAEMTLFNLTYLAQIMQNDVGLIRNHEKLPDSPLKTFWQSLADEDLSTTATRNAWTQLIIRKQGVIYRKGGTARQTWQESDTSSHWAELNPGILNQMRALFHLLGKADEAESLVYAESTEETVAAAALKLSRLLSGKNVDDALSDASLPFAISVSNLENKPKAKDWFGELGVEIEGAQIAAWHFQTEHSSLNVSSKKQQVFDSAIKTTNPLLVGQMFSVTETNCVVFFNLNYCEKLDNLKKNGTTLAKFFQYANLANERVRRELGVWLCGGQKNDSVNRTANAEDKVLIPYTTKLLWGMCQVDEGAELRILNSSTTLKTLKQPTMQRLISFSDAKIDTDFFDGYSQNCLAYRSGRTRLNEINPEFLVPENRIGALSLDVLQESITSSDDIERTVAKVLKTLEALKGKLNCFSLIFSFSKSCLSEDIAQIMSFMPKILKRLLLRHDSTISPEQFFALVNSLQHQCEIDMFNITRWYPYDYRDSNYATLPPTLEECVFNLLEPLASSGKPFEPPFINFGDENDLEPVYERLRTIAATQFSGVNDDEFYS